MSQVEQRENSEAYKNHVRIKDIVEQIKKEYQEEEEPSLKSILEEDSVSNKIFTKEQEQEQDPDATLVGPIEPSYLNDTEELESEHSVSPTKNKDTKAQNEYELLIDAKRQKLESLKLQLNDLKHRSYEQLAAKSAKSPRVGPKRSNTYGKINERKLKSSKSSDRIDDISETNKFKRKRTFSDATIVDQDGDTIIDDPEHISKVEVPQIKRQKNRADH